MVASKSLARRHARLIHLKVRSTTQLLGRTVKPLLSRSVRLTTVIAIRLASKRHVEPHRLNRRRRM